MITALLYNRASHELRELDRDQVISTMPSADETAAARADMTDGSSFHNTQPHCRIGEVLWIDVQDPSAEDYELLARRFNLHAMVVEDIKAREGRPKLHDYKDYLYLIFHALTCSATTPEKEGDEVVTVPESESAQRFQVNVCEVDCLVGPDYVVTIHHEPVAPLEDLRSRWKRRPTLMQSGSAYLLYEIMDEVLDDYFPILDALDERIDDFEDRLFQEWQEKLSADIFTLKRSLLQIRRIAGPTRDVVNILLRHETDSGGKHFAYFQDLYDHASRIVDSVDTFRELLSGVLDAYLAMASNRMNGVMKTLTSASIILLVPTLIAGIYGMNFGNMPELHDPYGYHKALGIMAAIIVVLTIYFKRKQWL
jgi:magnesium transporter